jgi:hypothetical protein
MDARQGCHQGFQRAYHQMVNLLAVRAGAHDENFGGGYHDLRIIQARREEHGQSPEQGDGHHDQHSDLGLVKRLGKPPRQVVPLPWFSHE